MGGVGPFSLHTILVLRLAVTLKDKFRLELHAHRALFAQGDRFRSTGRAGLGKM